MGRMLVRTIGVVRARFKIGMMNLAYNLRRLAWLKTSPGGGDGVGDGVSEEITGGRAPITAPRPAWRRVFTATAGTTAT
jgi:hypothetical protein